MSLWVAQHLKDIDVSVQCFTHLCEHFTWLLGLCLVPGTWQIPYLMTQRGNALYCLIMCLQIAWEHNCVTNWILMRYGRFKCHIISMVLIPTWRRWFEPIWWLKPCDCSGVYCMWLTFYDVSYICSSHHVIIVVYTILYANVFYCVKWIASYNKVVCWLFWTTDSLSE